MVHDGSGFEYWKDNDSPKYFEDWTRELDDLDRDHILVVADRQYDNEPIRYGYLTPYEFYLAAKHAVERTMQNNPERSDELSFRLEEIRGHLLDF
jgi:hypothetical protein